MAPLDAPTVERNLSLLHAWITHPRSAFWGMQAADVSDVRGAYGAPHGIAVNPHHDAWLGFVEDRPTFLAETYDPQHSALADRPEVAAGDLGMHLLVAPPPGPQRPGLTRQVFAFVMDHCFTDPDVARVVVEPDVRNHAIARLNAAAGFVIAGEIDLPDKRAALSFCTRAAFAAARPTLVETSHA